MKEGAKEQLWFPKVLQKTWWVPCNPVGLRPSGCFRLGAHISSDSLILFPGENFLAELQLYTPLWRFGTDRPGAGLPQQYPAGISKF